MTPEKDAWLKWTAFQGAEDDLTDDDKRLAAQYALTTGGNDVNKVPPTLRSWISKESAGNLGNPQIPADSPQTALPRTSVPVSVSQPQVADPVTAPAVAAPLARVSDFGRAVADAREADARRFAVAEPMEKPEGESPRVSFAPPQPSFQAGRTGSLPSVGHLTAVRAEGEQGQVITDEQLPGLREMPRDLYPLFVTPLNMREGEAPLNRLVLPTVMVRGGQRAFDVNAARRRLTLAETARILRDDYKTERLGDVSPEVIAEAQRRAREWADEKLKDFRLLNPDLLTLDNPEGPGAVSQAIGSVLGEDAAKVVAPIEETMWRQDRGWFDPGAQLWRGASRDVSNRTNSPAWDALERVTQVAPSTPIASWMFNNVEWGSPQHLELIRNGYDAFDDVGPLTAVLAKAAEQNVFSENGEVHPERLLPGSALAHFISLRRQGKAPLDALNEVTGDKYEALPGWTELDTATRTVGTPAFIAAMFLEPDLLAGATQAASFSGRVMGKGTSTISDMLTGKAATRTAFESTAETLRAVAEVVDETPESLDAAYELLRRNPNTQGIANEVLVQTAAQLSVPADNLTQLRRAMHAADEAADEAAQTATVVEDLNKQIATLQTTVGTEAKQIEAAEDAVKNAKQTAEAIEASLEAVRNGINANARAAGAKGADLEWTTSLVATRKAIEEGETAAREIAAMSKGKEDLLDQVAARTAARRAYEAAETQAAALRATKPATRLVWADDAAEMRARIEKMVTGTDPTSIKFKEAVKAAAAQVVTVTDVRARRLAFANKLRSIEKTFEAEKASGWVSPLSNMQTHVAKLAEAEAKLKAARAAYEAANVVIVRNPEATQFANKVARLQEVVRRAQVRATGQEKLFNAFRIMQARAIAARAAVQAAEKASKDLAASIGKESAQALKAAINQRNLAVAQIAKLSGKATMRTKVAQTFQSILHQFANSADIAAKNISETGDAFKSADTTARAIVPSISTLGKMLPDGTVELTTGTFHDYVKTLDALFHSSDLAPIWKVVSPMLKPSVKGVGKGATEGVDVVALAAKAAPEGGAKAAKSVTKLTGEAPSAWEAQRAAIRTLTPAQVRELQQAEEAAIASAKLDSMSKQQLLQAAMLADAWKRSDLFFSPSWAQSVFNMARRLVDAFDANVSRFGRTSETIAEQANQTMARVDRARDEVHDLWLLSADDNNKLLRLNEYLSSTAAMPFRGESTTIANRGYSATNVAPRSFFEDAARYFVGGKKADLPEHLAKLDDAVAAVGRGEQVTPEVSALLKERDAFIANDAARRAGLSAEGASLRESMLSELTTAWVGAGRVISPGQLSAVRDSVIEAFSEASDFASFMQIVKKRTSAFTDTETFERAYLIGAQTVIHAAEAQRLAYRTQKALGVGDTAKLSQTLNDVRSGLTKQVDALETILRAHVAYGLPVNVPTFKAGGQGAEVLNVLQKIGTAENGTEIFMPKQVVEYVDGYLSGVTKTLAYLPAEQTFARKAWDAAYGFMTRYRASMTVGYGIPNYPNIAMNAFSDAIQAWATVGAPTAARVTVRTFADNFPVIGRAVRALGSKMLEKSKGKPVLGTILETAFDPLVDAVWRGRDGLVRLGNSRVASYEDLQRWAVEDRILEAYVPEGMKQLLARSFQNANARLARADARAIDSVTTFSNTIQARRRLSLYLDLLQRGYSRGEARQMTLDAYYDWSHGISKFESDWLVHFGMFYRFTSLSTRQMARTLSEPFTWSNKSATIGQQYMRAVANSRIARVRDIAALQSNAQDFFTDYPQQDEILNDMEQLQAYTDYFHAPWWSNGRSMPFKSNVLNDAQAQRYLRQTGKGGVGEPGISDRMVVQSMLPSDSIIDRFVWSMMLGQLAAGTLAYATGGNVPKSYLEDRASVLTDWMNPLARTLPDAALEQVFNISQGAHYGFVPDENRGLLAPMSAKEAGVLRALDLALAQPVANLADPMRSRLAQFRPPIFETDGVPVLYKRDEATGQMYTNAAFLSLWRMTPVMGTQWLNQFGNFIATPYEAYSDEWFKFAFGSWLGVSSSVLSPVKDHERAAKDAEMALREIVESTTKDVTHGERRR